MSLAVQQQRDLTNLAGKYIKDTLTQLEALGYVFTTDEGRELRKHIVDGINEMSREMFDILSDEVL